MSNKKIEKHLKIDPLLLQRAKEILDTKTDSETIEKSLNFIISEDYIRESIKEMKGVGGIEKIYD